MVSQARSIADLFNASEDTSGLRGKHRRPLRILVHGLNFWPDPTGVAKYTFEMAEWLVRRNHEVVVITAPPYYPAWKIAEGYRAFTFARENVSGIKVLRFPLYVPRRQSATKRILHALSFGVSSWPATLFRACRWRPDLVWTVAPSIIAAGTALSTARLAGVPAWLHVQDLEADAAFALGLAGGKRLQRAAVSLESRFIRQFDRVSTISDAMRARVVQKGCDPDRVTLVPNWVDLDRIRPFPRPNSFRDALGLADDDIVALYSGTIGRKQGLSIILQAAEKLSSNQRLHFVVAGDGPEQPRLQAAAAHLKRVHFLPLQPVEQLPEFLSAADVHLLPQVAHAADLVLPSKLSGMMASARPVIATAEPETDLAREVAPNGIVTPPGDAEAFAVAIAALAADGARRERLGRTARERAAAMWDRDFVLGRLEAEFLALAAAGDMVQAVPGS